MRIEKDIKKRFIKTILTFVKLHIRIARIAYFCLKDKKFPNTRFSARNPTIFY